MLEITIHPKIRLRSTGPLKVEIDMTSQDITFEIDGQRCTHIVPGYLIPSVSELELKGAGNMETNVGDSSPSHSYERQARQVVRLLQGSQVQ